MNGTASSMHAVSEGVRTPGIGSRVVVESGQHAGTCGKVQRYNVKHTYAYILTADGQIIRAHKYNISQVDADGYYLL